MGTASSIDNSNGAPQTSSAGRGWWAVLVLFLAYTLSYIDRIIIALLVEPLRADLGLSDTQVSLLLGLAFAIFYSTMSVPIAILADRRSRTTIISVGVFFWSLMTSLCGLATNFWQMFLARMGVGIGEATLGPAAYSLIADLFTEEKRGRAMAVFSSGVTVGGGLAFLIGGAIVGFASASGTIDTFLGELRSWQIVFLVLGPPGILISLLVLTIAEPRRGVSGKIETAAAVPLRPFLAGEKLPIFTLFLGFAVSGTIMTALVSWAPTFLIRTHGLSASEAGQALGLGLLLFGPVGAIAGGTLSDLWTRRGRTESPMLTGFIGVALMGVAGVAAPLMPTAFLSVAAFSVAFFAGSFAYPAGAAALQKLTPSALRARVAALYLFAVTVISTTLGPTMVALFTDYLFGDPAAIGQSLVVSVALTAPIGLLCLATGARAFRRSIERAQADGD